jgi:hypothetical protein
MTDEMRPVMQLFLLLAESNRCQERDRWRTISALPLDAWNLVRAPAGSNKGKPVFLFFYSHVSGRKSLKAKIGLYWSAEAAWN